MQSSESSTVLAMLNYVPNIILFAALHLPMKRKTTPNCFMSLPFLKHQANIRNWKQHNIMLLSIINSQARMVSE